MSVASVPHCRMDILLFPVGRRENTGFKFCHQDHRNSSPPVLSREQIVMSSAEAFVAGMKRNCLLFHTHTPHVPPELQGGLPSSGLQFHHRRVTGSSDIQASQVLECSVCWISSWYHEQKQAGCH